MFTLDLQWKEMNLNLNMIQDRIKVMSPECCGLSGNSSLQVHFTEKPSDEIIAQIESYYNGLDNASEEAMSYKSQAQVVEEERMAKDVALASARAKLAALGLNAEEIKAILGA